MSKIILGIDPGSIKTGFAVIHKEGRSFRYVESGILKFDAKKEFVLRIASIYSDLQELVNRINPDEVAFESLIYVKNVSSLAKLAQARGAMIAACSTIKMFEYSPTLVKNTVTQDGHASKQGVSKVLEMVFGKITFKTHDESDALAIALCHGLLEGRQNDRPLIR